MSTQQITAIQSVNTLVQDKASNLADGTTSISRSKYIYKMLSANYKSHRFLAEIQDGQLAVYQDGSLVHTIPLEGDYENTQINFHDGIFNVLNGGEVFRFHCDSSVLLNDKLTNYVSDTTYDTCLLMFSKLVLLNYKLGRVCILDMATKDKIIFNVNSAKIDSNKLADILFNMNDLVGITLVDDYQIPKIITSGNATGNSGKLKTSKNYVFSIHNNVASVYEISQDKQIKLIAKLKGVSAVDKFIVKDQTCLIIGTRFGEESLIVLALDTQANYSVALKSLINQETKQPNTFTDWINLELYQDPKNTDRQLILATRLANQIEEHHLIDMQNKQIQKVKYDTIST